MQVRYISPKGDVSIISAEEAESIVQNAFCRNGRVVVKRKGRSVFIEDENGQTILTPILDKEHHENKP